MAPDRKDAAAVLEATARSFATTKLGGAGCCTPRRVSSEAAPLALLRLQHETPDNSITVQP
jgi:hypothetical protein